ncbi:DUF885 domain-containing protein [Pseudoxanthomonas sp. SGNA-20]|uniref:DUF885 domain-containing protein n=1 Tax=unclassified Pseudoxanthomonas TaxID=2645906 RepID=UPI0002F2E4F6|nr:MULTISPECIES: DUF885 domain-containing protein [unclassified Pseudoxanthomonas]RRN56339.1 DUF885 domain-containing protein [Pseudoxanthomonas sp. SGNA-20]RRN79864.1 DUF885 domain-containing protein [Pseudoxanthomonas sp. SGD-10]
MSQLSRASVLALSLLLAPGLAAASPAAAANRPAAEASAAAQALRELYTAEWEWRQREYGYEYVEGRWQPGSRLPAVAPRDWERRVAYWEQVLRRLDAIPAAALPPEERINAEVFRAMVEADLNNARWRTWEAPFNSDSFFWAEIVPWAPYRSEAEWRRFIQRLRDVPRYFADQRANMEAGLARGWSVPRASLDGRDRTIEPYTRTGAGNPALDVFDAIPASVPEEVRRALREEGRKVVLEQVVPAYAGLLDYFRNQYLPRTRTTVSARDLPGGAEFYRSQIREYVTLDMTPEQVHQLGLAEVERISAEMRQVMARAGFQGSFAEFLQFLRTDPRFYARTPRELLAAASYHAKRIDGELNHVIGTLPRYRFTIRPVPDDIAPNYTSGRGGLESCLFNTWDLPSRPLYNLPALVLHECAPGHSLQAALALEAPARPEFRQQVYFSGYGEGWGLYTEWLGTQMGIYETPYEEFGRLTFEMWRAARLVIDTGLHEYGWSRQQAIDYLASHTALAHIDIVNEVDRYISWPGQALSYYVGYRTILDLRREAERELGARFDQKAFHDRILGLGAVPLTTLQREVRAFMAEARDKPAAAAAP